MKRSVFVISMVFISFASLGQVTYFDTNNFFLHYFTDTGFSRYDWRFEPLKTDKERGNLKGDIVKVVTNITDKTGRGYGDNFTDTTYYNPDGNIKKIVALKRDEFDPKKIFRPDVWLYEYDKEGGLNGYTKLSQVEVWGGGKEMRKEVHTTVHNSQGKIIKEVSNTFSQHNNKWEAIGESNVIWAFAYDTAGNLVSGKGPLNTSLSYKNGQLTKMQEATEQPVTYTYDAVGHLEIFARRLRRHGIVIVSGRDTSDSLLRSLLLHIPMMRKETGQKLWLIQNSVLILEDWLFQLSVQLHMDMWQLPAILDNLEE